jgi:hypothetical protein
VWELVPGDEREKLVMVISLILRCCSKTLFRVVTL